MARLEMANRDADSSCSTVCEMPFLELGGGREN